MINNEPATPTQKPAVARWWVFSWYTDLGGMNEEIKKIRGAYSHRSP